MRIEYSTNNSGGSWWLNDKDWIALEKAGWHVEWGGKYFCHSEYSFNKRPKGKPEPCANSKECPGHRKYDTAAEAADDRYMGALSHDAWKNVESPAEAMREFEKVTGQEVSAEGCNCCGPPHSFSWGNYEDGTHGYASGEECLTYLFKNPPKSLRAAAEALDK